MKHMRTTSISGSEYTFADITAYGMETIRSLPYSLRILLENLIRNHDGTVVTDRHIDALLSRNSETNGITEVPFFPARVLMQDFTGVPAIVDISAMRDAVKERGMDPSVISPKIPVDLVVDHSVQVDFFGSPDAAEQNVRKEYERNSERYALLKWAQKTYSNFRVVPPNTGICHQVNLEYLAECVKQEESLLYPDSLVGTDSHTPMVNGLGVFGWGVGGIEAEAALLGQPYYIPLPNVIGVKLTGTLESGCTAADLVLHITELLRKIGVVGAFVEYFGPGLEQLSLPDRATIANMSPEYGAAMGFFPIDERTIEYLELTGRSTAARRTRAYAEANALFHETSGEPACDRIVELDLGTVQPSAAGPFRPQDRISIAEIKTNVRSYVFQKHNAVRTKDIVIDDEPVTLQDGTLAIAAITSCTNTSNPAVMIGAGLLAKNAVNHGLKTPAWVKTSLAPGSKVVIDYLKSSGLLSSLEELGFYLAAFGCTTCIGNSGPLHPDIEEAQIQEDLILAAALSGNRNFSGRIHPRIQASYLMSPMHVVAFALAGRIDFDFSCEPLGWEKCETADNIGSADESADKADAGNASGSDGDSAGSWKPVFLRDIWPDAEEIEKLAAEHVKKQFYDLEYADIFSGDHFWKHLPAPDGETFSWDPASSYIAQPPFFRDLQDQPQPVKPITHARPLLMLYDSVTTDHISPAGAIDMTYPAGTYLLEQGIQPSDFNSYGARRGNHEVMIRGTFGNTRIRQALTAPKEGGFTRKFPEGTVLHVYDAAMAYQKEGTELIILAGKEYGTGSSRDWAAKGTALLGVRAVIAESFERIHRSNLVGMGVLPLVFEEGESWQSLGLTGEETFSIPISDDLEPGQRLQVTADRPGAQPIVFSVRCRLDSPMEATYWKHGGILQYFLRSMLKE